MPIALETVIQQLEDSGIVAQGKLENFIPPRAHPKSVEELVSELVKQNHLTKFQAQQVSLGKAKALILGGYTILDKIGAGGMGQVFKAQHRRMDRIVAVKTLPAKMMKDAGAVARFEREVKAAAKLRHPNIVAADDADEANGLHFLVMEYVEGSDLSALVKKNGPFLVQKAINIILQAARGLEFAHSEGVVHRDIKPANLLLDKKGVVKILDMGLARIDAAGDAATQAELTGTGTIMGTVDYMAPEQALSTKNADARADVYSLGCSLYYLLAGKATYDGETLMGKMLAHRQDPIPSLRDVQADVPDELEAVFNKMVAKNVEDRYQTITEVVADLEKCSSGQSTSQSIQQSASTNLDNSALKFLKSIEVTPTLQKNKATKQVAPAKSGEGKQPPWKNTKVLIGIGAAGFLILLLGVWVIVRDKDGKEVAKVKVPDGGSVKVQEVKQGPFAKSAKKTDPGAKVPTTTASVTPQPTASPRKLFIHDPAFQAWMKTVQALPAEKQIEAVSKKLMELNPGFDGKLTWFDGSGTPKILKGVVIDLGFVGDNVIDISPVRALVGLSRLNCSGSREAKGKLTDLSPLQGMRLTSLNCGSTNVADLSPLQGMPLTRLACYSTPVSDLLPVTTLPTLGYLAVQNTKVTPEAITALQEALPNCQIESQFYGQTGSSSKPITNINAPAFQKWMNDVQAMPADKQVDAVSKKLMELNPGFDGKMTGWDTKGTPKIKDGVVTELGFHSIDISDISPVRALQGLKELYCPGTIEQKGKLSDLSPLKGMQLTSLNCSSSKVADLTPLKGMPLRVLLCAAVPVADLSPIQGMPLTELNVYHTGISDLSPLKGMRLTTLHCGQTQITDISILKGMPLRQVWCLATQVSDLSPLGDCTSLRYLAVDRTKVTPAGVAALQKALPHCKIEWDDPTKAKTPAK